MKFFACGGLFYLYCLKNCSQVIQIQPESTHFCEFFACGGPFSLYCVQNCSEMIQFQPQNTNFRKFLACGRLFILYCLQNCSQMLQLKITLKFFRLRRAFFLSLSKIYTTC